MMHAAVAGWKVAVQKVGKIVIIRPATICHCQTHQTRITVRLTSCLTGLHSAGLHYI